MYSNERRSPDGRPAGPRRNYYPSSLNQPRPPVMETTHQEMEIQVERKFIAVALKENTRGRFLRIMEDGGGHHRSSVIIPISGLTEFKLVIEALTKAAATLPLWSTPQSPA